MTLLNEGAEALEQVPEAAPHTCIVFRGLVHTSGNCQCMVDPKINPPAVPASLGPAHRPWDPGYGVQEYLEARQERYRSEWEAARVAREAERAERLARIRARYARERAANR